MCWLWITACDFLACLSLTLERSIPDHGHDNRTFLSSSSTIHTHTSTTIRCDISLNHHEFFYLVAHYIEIALFSFYQSIKKSTHCILWNYKFQSQQRFDCKQRLDTMQMINEPFMSVHILHALTNKTDNFLVKSSIFTRSRTRKTLHVCKTICSFWWIIVSCNHGCM